MTRSSSGASQLRRPTVSAVGIAVLCLLLIGLALRARLLTATPSWVDEAESSINALSILELGCPADRYLGLPIYENMLVRPWPDHPEYEFKDISYSDRGVAVYHGWLPLYAMAASFKCLGVNPPRAEPGWQVQVDVADMVWRTLAARLPSMLFAAVFLWGLFVAGRRMAGDDVALAVLTLGGLSRRSSRSRPSPATIRRRSR